MDFQTVTGGGLPPASPYNVTAVSLAKACLLAVTTTLILLGNSLCLLVLRCTRDGVSPVTKLFLVSLTISDLLVGVLVGVPVVGSTALQGWPYGDAYCTVVAMCHALYFNAGMSVLAINIERYVAVIWPLRYPLIVTVARAAIVEVFIVSALLLWLLLYVFMPNRKSFYYSNFSQCFIDSLNGNDFLGHVAMTVFIGLPLVITIVLHVRLYRLANRHASKVGNITLGRIRSATHDPDSAASHTEEAVPNRGAGPPAVRRRARRTSPETKTARTFFLMAVVLTVSWTPYYATIAWENLRSDPVPEALAFASQLLLLLNSIWNVVIYYTRNDAFRKTAHRLLGCCVPVHRRNGQQLVT